MCIRDSVRSGRILEADGEDAAAGDAQSVDAGRRRGGEVERPGAHVDGHRRHVVVGHGQRLVRPQSHRVRRQTQHVVPRRHHQPPRVPHVWNPTTNGLQLNGKDRRVQQAWRHGATVGRWTSDQEVVGSIPGSGRNYVTTVVKSLTPTCLDADSVRYYMESVTRVTFTFTRAAPLRELTRHVA